MKQSPWIWYPIRRKNGTLAARVRIDIADIDLVTRHQWRLSSEGYAVRSETVDGKKQTLYLHREVTQPPDGMVVDHRNRDRLDCRRENLRVVTHSENNSNTAPRSSTGFKGVYYHRVSGKYLAQLCNRGRVRHLGLFASAEAAAQAWLREARQVRNDLAEVELDLD